MKKKLLLFILGFSFLVVFFQSKSLADSVEKTISVTLNSIKLIVNGSNIQTDNFIYNETTYIPLRQVSETFKKEVSWDEKTRTIEIKDQKAASSNTDSKSLRYVGETKRDGKGTYTWPNGDTYSGEWKQGVMNGQGIFNYYSGEQYTGEYRNNERVGYGKMIWTNQEWYEGEWEKDFMSGEGTYNFVNGDKYVGKWQFGKMNGLGTYSFHNGMKLTGSWQDNKLVQTLNQE